MEQNYKIEYFQYILHKLLDWHKDVKGETTPNDITILKGLKLLFFTSAVITSEEREDLLSIFDSYWAMPYGHVESEVYDVIKNKELDFFQISKNSGLVKKGDYKIESLTKSLDKQKLALIDESIKALRNSNENLISYSPFDLVELSHQWYSWRNNYKIANKQGMRSQKIPVDDIRVESKFFKLTTI